MGRSLQAFHPQNKPATAHQTCAIADLFLFFASPDPKTFLCRVLFLWTVPGTVLRIVPQNLIRTVNKTRQRKVPEG